MAEQAQVASIDALEAFRASLLVYLSRVRPLLEDACDEVARTREWLQHDRRIHWENQVRLRLRKLEEAQQAVFSAQLSNLRDVHAAEQAALTRARRSLGEAEEKLRLVKRWSLEYPHRIDPVLKELESLRTVLANTMPKAAAHLGIILKSLHAYAAVGRVSSGAGAPAESQEGIRNVDSPEAREEKL